MNRSFTTALALAAALLGACDRPSRLSEPEVPLPRIPELELSAGAVAFQAPAGTAEPAPRTIHVVNAGGGSLAVPSVAIAYLDGAGWLTATVSGEAAPFAIELQATAAGLGPRTYRATLTVTCENAGTPVLEVPVTFVVPDRSYTTTTAALAFVAPAAGDPAAQALQVVNGGRGTLPVPDVEISYAGTPGWLSAQVSGAAEPYTVTVAAHELPGMASGIHAATLSIGSASVGGWRHAVPVSFTLAPELVVSASLTSFVPGPSDRAPLSQTFTVTNVGRGVLPPPTVTATGAGWLDAKVVSSTEPYTVVVSAEEYRALIAGDYLGTVTVSSPGAATSPVVEVSLHVAPAVMNVAGTVSWSVYGGCPLPERQSVTVGNTGLGFLPRPAVTIPPQAASWLAAAVVGSWPPYRVDFSVIAPPPVAPASSISTVAVIEAAGAAAAVQVPVTYAAPVPAITGTRAAPSPVVIHAQAGTGGLAPGLLSIGTVGGCIPAPHVSYAYAPGDPAWLSWSLATTVQRHDVLLHASTEGIPAGATRNLTLYLSSTRPGASAPLYEENVSLVLENATIALTGPLSTGRYGHAAVALADGRVLVTGGKYYTPPDTHGFGWQEVLSSVELYDPAQGRFDPYPPLMRGRALHGAAALDDGRVVVCGGTSTYWEPDDTGTCEVSAGGAWTALGSIQKSRTSPSIVPLPSGRLLIAGLHGRADNTADLDVEVLDLATGQAAFVTGAGTGERVTGSAAVKLADGRILVAGGRAGATWLYDPAADRWTRSGDLVSNRIGPAMVPLPDGRALAVNGDSVGDPWPVRGAEIWDPRAEAWSEAGSPSYRYRTGSLAVLANGRVAAFGGETLSMNPGAGEVELFDPATLAWSVVTGTALPAGRMASTVNGLPGGRLLIVGGQLGGQGSGTSLAEAFTW